MADTAQQKRAFLNFLDEEGYTSNVTSMLNKGGTRLRLNLNDLRKHDAKLTQNFLRRPADYIPAFEEALKEMAAQLDPAFAKQQSHLSIGVEGSFGKHHVSPRGLGAHLLNCLVYVEGIVTKVSLVRPKVGKSAHYCPATGKFTYKEYRDATSLTGVATGSAYPTKDGDGNLLQTEYGLSDYTDHQSVTLQEMPERAPPGQLPRSVEVLLEGDLVDQCKPGDRMQVAGVHRALPSKANASGMFRTIVLGNHVRQLNKELASSAFTAEDVINIKRFAKRPDCLQLLSQSLAPSIFGHAFEKRALLLMLLGGTERNLLNGTHLRGDINILMLGDPSTAKSQLLRAVMRTAPLAISTTGRGSSGVGLTASVTVDSDTGNRRLEAGAMVLADRGICCVDEFDKMMDADRVAIHEVMEQQTVTISKAGIHASLNARCAVVAAANPIYGQYDPNLPPMRNIALPDSLLSRFDLLFIILDKKEQESDRRISEHVLRMHCSRRTVSASAAPMGVVATGEKAGEARTSTVYAKADAAQRIAGGDDVELCTTEFVKKFIHYAKVKFSPQLQDDAAKHITEAYATLRERVADSAGRTLPVTARTLETMIRLASAHAKCHLRGEVTQEDAESAVALLNYALLSDPLDEQGGRKPKAMPEGYEPMEAVDGEGAAAAAGPAADAQADAADAAAEGDAGEVAVTAERRAVVEAALKEVCVFGKEECSLGELVDQVRKAAPMGPREAVAILQAMQRDDKVMYVETAEGNDDYRLNQVHLI